MRNRSKKLAAFAIAGLTILYGCSRGARDAATPLAPATSAVSTTAEPAEAKIVIPFDPADFANPQSNPYFPLAPGSVWSYVAETADGTETNEVAVTSDTKVIEGVTVAVIHDRVWLNGSLTEDTFDWYAPDKDGNVWYFGEDTKTVENGVVVSTQGSWESGKNGAKAGLIMLAQPHVGDTYSQENAPGIVADMGKVLSLKESVSVPYGSFDSCLKTADWTPLEPGNRSFKYYARGIGVVLETTARDGERVELTGFTKP